ncbi:hypothetical protein ACFHYQ_17520 [Sphaerimonospora cavernae]|uniref:Uncharacterized protein n=1 Tax=Sphaerimonospora cavernae TaxID=1740611 RepID=A0ABV6U7Z6_9ACTN
MSEPDKDLLRKALARAVALLTGTDCLIVVEAAADGIATFAIHQDEHGTPRARRWFSSWADLTAASAQEDPTAGRDAVLQTVTAVSQAHPGDISEVVLARSVAGNPAAEQALEWLCQAHPPDVYSTDTPVAGLVKEAIRDDPLTRSYDLVVLRPDPATGRLDLGGRQLFPVGTRPGTLTDVTVRCEPGDEYGTAFAVVTWQGREPRLLSVASVHLVPGTYTLTAELVRAGKVRFTGLPGLVEDPRGWGELIASVPSLLPPATRAAHLICGVEICGPDEKVIERLGRAHQVIAFLAAEFGDRLRVSLLAYGAHSFDQSAPEHPVEVTAWRATPEHALAGLRLLEERGAITRGFPYHPHAAQLEDMLATVVRRLLREGTAVDGLDQHRPAPTVLLTVGDRPPHPARADRSGVLPCPHRHDWQTMFQHLGSRPGTVFGAIWDQSPDRARTAHLIWRYLGTSALAHLDALDVRELTADLGLAAPVVGRIPFPLIDDTE